MVGQALQCQALLPQDETCSPPRPWVQRGPARDLKRVRRVLKSSSCANCRVARAVSERKNAFVLCVRGDGVGDEGDTRP